MLAGLLALVLAGPVQGHLFVIRVAAPPGSGMVSATGVAGGEALHFQAVDSVLESLAPVPIGVTDTIDAWIQATYEDGRTQADSLRIPVAAGEYEHEEVYLNHGGGLLSAYFHLSEQLVEPGDTVTAGTPIRRVGATGRVTGPHLHWVVRYGTTSVDPRSLLALP